MQKSYQTNDFLQCRSKQVKAAISANNMERYMVPKVSKVGRDLPGLYLVEPVLVSEKAVCKAGKVASSMSSVDPFIRRLVIRGTNLVLMW